jgi:hypothetical protein
MYAHPCAYLLVLVSEPALLVQDHRSNASVQSKIANALTAFRPIAAPPCRGSWSLERPKATSLADTQAATLDDPGRQRVPASVAAVSTTSKSWVIVAVLAIIADAEQYFSTDSAMARSTFSGATPRPFTTKCI